MRSDSVGRDRSKVEEITEEEIRMEVWSLGVVELVACVASAC